MSTTYTLAPCTIADGAAISRNNMSAFWEDKSWVIAWRHTTLEAHIIEIAKRVPRNLLNDRATLRHQKALHPETGRLMGYCRWILPAEFAILADGTPAWPEAQTPAVSAEEEAEIRRVADTAVFNPDQTSDALDVPVGETRREILAKKSYMRK